MVSFAIVSFALTPFILPAYIGPGAGISFAGSFFGLIIAFGLLFLSLLTWPIRILLMWVRRRRAGLKGHTQRVVVLGLDGLDPGRVRRLMSEGRLPHLKRLAERGAFTDLATTLPPISPVAWSSFQTGVNPGKHNIFDFLNRNLRTYLPELSSTRIVEGVSGWRSWVGLGGASIRMLRKSQQFWKILGDFGIFSTILRVPITFPPEKFFGLSLSAMCTPDLRGTQGSFTLFSTDPAECRETTGGLRILVQRIAHRIDALLPGPPQSSQSGSALNELRTPLRITISQEENSIELRVGRERIRLLPQQDSPWIHIEFRQGWFTRVSGICRFRVESLQPHFRLYVSPIHLDPERPAMPISHPSYYSLYLGKLHDAFATLGLAEDTWALNSGAISEAAFLDQAWAIHDERERMFFDALRRMQRGLTVCVFDAPDRIQHMFYRHDNAEHPANADRDITRYAHVLDQMYERMDNLVGRAAKEVDDRSVLIVLSDHGFCDFSRGVNLNAWLRDQGYLVTHQDTGTGDYLKGVDWSKTRAYAFGLSGIYLNQQGRESRGIVPPADAAALRAEIIARLTDLPDPERGGRAIKRVYDTHQAYRGPYAGNGPDLVVGYERGYRASWENAVGRCDGSVIQDNTRFWSGDHCVDPELVPGVLFCNRPLVTDRPASILDLAPTILDLFGVPAPRYFDGQSLWPQTAAVNPATVKSAPKQPESAPPSTAAATIAPAAMEVAP